MRKRTLRKLIGVALTATLAFTGCGSGGDGSTGIIAGGGGVAVDGGGGGAAAATGGTTGFGLTGGSSAGGGGGGGGGGGTGTTGGTTTAATGTTTTTTTGGTTTGGNFLATVQGTDLSAGLNATTFFSGLTVSGLNKNYVLQGFRTTNGSLGAINTNGVRDPNNGFPVQTVAAEPGFLTNVLNSPFDIINDGTSFYLTAGIDSFGNGRIVRVSNLSEAAGVITGRFENLTAGSTPIPNNPAFLTQIPLVVGGNTVNFIYWTEYVGAGQGSVRRIRADGTGTAETVVNTLSFPAGIAHDGTRLMICESAGGGSSLGRVITAPINPPTIPLDGTSLTDVTEITVAGGQAAIGRPFDVTYDGRNGFFFTEGGSILGVTGAPGSLGGGTGTVRFIPNGQTVASLVGSGFTSVAGIDATDTDGDGTSAILFCESLSAPNGAIRRQLVNTANVTNVVASAASIVDTGLSFPLGVGIISETTPSFIASLFFTSPTNGSIRTYAP